MKQALSEQMRRDREQLKQALLAGANSGLGRVVDRRYFDDLRELARGVTPDHTF